MFDVAYLKPCSAFPRMMHSDTIFGAICSAINELFGRSEMEKMKESKFLVSSAFPFSKVDDNTAHFFPKPILMPKKVPSNLMEKAKKYKKISLLHHRTFENIINGKLTELEIIENIERYSLQHGALFPKEEKLEFRIETIDIPRNVIKRLNSKSEDFFYTTLAHFENCGLFFLIKYLDEDYRAKVEAALRFMEDKGFGGDLSVGKGHFKLEFDRIGIKEPENGTAFTTLSLYSPGDEISLFGRNMWYELINREGKSADGVSKMRVPMFKEGSTFPLVEKQLYGRIQIVRESPQVFQYGYAFPIKVVKGSES